VRRVGKVGRRRAAALRTLKPLLLARSGNRCETPWCRRRGKLDPHHIVPRSLGGGESLANLVMLDRRCHEAVDLPKAVPGRLVIRVLRGEEGEVSALFEQGDLLQARRLVWHIWVPPTLTAGGKS